MKEIKAFLMFSGERHGQAKAAIDLYISLFPKSKLDHIDLYGPGDNEPAGTVRSAIFTLNGKQFMAMDSAAPHMFNFTPSISLFVECETEDEIIRFYNSLSKEGKILMPLDNYGFSPRFGWVNDRFGVSWQLNQAV